MDRQTMTDNYIVGSIILTLMVLTAYCLVSCELPLPPGPPTKLLSGNLHQVPKSEPWRTFAKWAEAYGPVIYFRIYKDRYVVLNSAKAAVDLLESRSSIYSDRPIVWMGKELVGRKLAVFNISSLNPRFKKYRKQLHSGLNSRATQTYVPLVLQETRVFLSGLASTPEDFISHIRRNSGAVILKIAYGWTVTKNDDELVGIMVETFSIAKEAMQPGRWLVDVLPWLRFVPSWVPGAGFQRIAAGMKERMSRLDLIPFNWAKEQIKSGNYTESFISMGLHPEGGKILSAEEEDVLKWCCAALYAGGADTTVSAMTTFFLLMSLNPQAQRRAQAEIERVVGTDRLPTVDDQKDLPYTMALIKEVLRWSPVVPLGLYHRVTENDEYQGFRIPKGATVIANIWAITHDSDMYPNPSVFDPERFLASPGVEAQPDPRKWVFGFGRRVCPGAYFAEISIFLNVTGVLSAFNISKHVNKDGQEVEPDISFSTNITSHLNPFKCRITPRSPDLLASLHMA